MPRFACLCLAALLAGLIGFLSLAASAAEVGLTFIDVPWQGQSLHGAVWYPTDTPPARFELGPYVLQVAQGAAVLPGKHALVVMSHGNGGSLLAHEDTAAALARAGFVVAAVTHAGDNYRVHDRELFMWERPPQISALIDAVLQRWAGHDAIDPARIGAFGFSAGGFTTLVLAGGKPDFSRIAPYCETHASTFVCTLRKAHEDSGEGFKTATWQADPRIRAAVVAAPALGFTFTKASLNAIAVPVQLWTAADDHVLPVEDNAFAVRDGLPRTDEVHVIPVGDHFAFLGPCPAALSETGAPFCRDPAGFDRVAFHRTFNAAVTAFFTRTLAQ